VLDVDGPSPKSVASIHCVGSRDQNYHAYCSRVCCMYSLKFAHLVKEKLPDASVYEYHIDMRCFGKGYEQFFERIKDEGVFVIDPTGAERGGISVAGVCQGPKDIPDAVARRVRDRVGIETVALTGGVFRNRLLVQQVARNLAAERFRVLLHAQVSPNDEGVALGQAWAGTLRLTG
jgi:predicted NodU family carbamoyl transferase